MNVSLTPELEQFVADKVRSGAYQTSSDVIPAGLLLLQERDEELELLRRDVRQGFEDIAQGRYTEYDQSTVGELVERVKARGRQRLAAGRQMNPAE